MHDSSLLDALDPLIGEGWIEDVLFEVKSGKEATVFCCRGAERAPAPLVAAKIYRAREHRGFANDAIYRAGRVEHARQSRLKRALDQASAFGREAQFGLWIHHEVEMLTRLARAGLPVPEPIATADRAILMPFIGDEAGAAPPLHLTAPSTEDAERIVDTILDAVADMLDLHVVHGDLSPYNILLWQDEPIIIDLPQAIDPRLNPAGFELLMRDVRRVCEWSERLGVDRDPFEIAADLWGAFREGVIG